MKGGCKVLYMELFSISVYTESIKLRMEAGRIEKSCKVFCKRNIDCCPSGSHFCGMAGIPDV